MGDKNDLISVSRHYIQWVGKIMFSHSLLLPFLVRITHSLQAPPTGSSEVQVGLLREMKEQQRKTNELLEKMIEKLPWVYSLLESCSRVMWEL